MSLSDFEILGKLGEGAFSQVFRVRRKTDNKHYALKKAKFATLKNKEKENALNEVRILASLVTPNIIEYKEAFFDDRNLCIVMEFAEHGDLLSKINEHKRNRTRFPEKEIWDALIQITNGLKILHDLKIVHRDLKCANIFIGNQYKLGDLNVSKVNKQGMVHTQTGTPYYASPEVWKDQPYNASSDIWSLGCVIYEMAALSPPFTANDMQGLYRKVIRGVYPNLPNCYSSDLSSVVRALLQVNPTSRPTCSQILELPGVLRQKALAPLQREEPSLLGTIKMSYNMAALKERLPAARYEEKKSETERHPPKKEVLSAAHLKMKPLMAVPNKPPSAVGTPTGANPRGNQRMNRIASLLLEQPQKVVRAPYQKPPIPRPYAQPHWWG